MTIPHRRCHRCRAVAYGQDVLEHKEGCAIDSLERKIIEGCDLLERETAVSETDTLRTQLAIAVEALEFYAGFHHNLCVGTLRRENECDCEAQKARTAIAKIKEAE